MKDLLSAKQLVRFPYCRIYRRFLNKIVENPAIRKQGQALLFRYAALFSLANFRPALRTVDGVRYAMQAGEWVATYRELCERLHLHTHKQARTLLHQLESMNLIEMQEVTRHKLVRFKICCWRKTNTTLSYSAPCPKDTGFFFFPVAQIPDLIGIGRCSEADMLLDLWMNTVYQDAGVPGSALGPVVYFRKKNDLPLVSCAALAARWGVSKATVHRVLKKFEQLSLVAVHHYPGKRGSVIVMQGYLSTMFSVADACPTRQALAAELALPTREGAGCPAEATSAEVTAIAAPFPWPADAVSKPNVWLILENLRNSLFVSGFRCSACPHALYRLSNLSGCRDAVTAYDLAIVCGAGGPSYRFSLKLEPVVTFPGVEVEVI